MTNITNIKTEYITSAKDKPAVLGVVRQIRGKYYFNSRCQLGNSRKGHATALQAVPRTLIGYMLPANDAQDAILKTKMFRDGALVDDVTVLRGRAW
jgi:hypothetical protein